MKRVLEIEGIQGKLIEYGKAHGYFIEKVKSLSRNGFPDLFCSHANCGPFLIEAKREPGVEPTKQQLKRHRELRAAGTAVYVIDDLDAGCELLRRMRDGGDAL